MKAFKDAIKGIGNVLLFYVFLCLIIWVINTALLASVGKVPTSLLDIMLIPVLIIRHARFI